jgi:hypothetical protein
MDSQVQQGTVTEPVAVWDTREDRWWDHWEARQNWLKAAGLTGLMMYRIEFRQVDGRPSGRIYCYALDAGGKRHWAPGHVAGPHDHDACDVAREEPYDILLHDLPPEELW